MIIITEPNVCILDCEGEKFPLIAEPLPDTENIRIFVADMLRKNEDSKWLLDNFDALDGFTNDFSITKRGGVILESRQYNFLFTGKEAEVLRERILRTIKPRIENLGKLKTLLESLK